VQLPTVTGLTVTSGSQVGSTTVTILGTGFTGATAISYGGTDYTVPHPLSDTALTFNTQPHTPGVVDVRVITPAGTSVISSADQFTYVSAPPPVITGIAPAKALTTGGSQVTIIGHGLLGATTVSFGDSFSSFVLVDSDAMLTAYVPAHAVGVVDVTVTTPGGTSAVSPADQFSFVTDTGTDGPVPVVTGLTPTSVYSGNDHSGSVLIIGTGFKNITNVAFGSVPSPNFYAESSTMIDASIPSGITGTVDVTVTTPGGTSVTTPVDQFTVLVPPRPTVTGVSPSAGSTAGGNSAVALDKVVITGTGFTLGTTVSFGSLSVSANAVEYVSDTTLTATAPAQAAGTVNVTVTTTGGTSVVTPADQYTYVTPPAPIITGLGPSSTSAAGSQVTIIGSHLTGATRVVFGDTPATYFSNISDTAINAIIPSHAPGTLDVTVTTPGGTSAISVADQFTYQKPQPPVLTALSPASATAAGGPTITLLGSGFNGTTVVSFGGTLVYANVISDNQISAQVPAHAVGVVDVTVTTPAGTTPTTPADRFTYTPPPLPVVTGLSLGSSSSGGGDTLTIIGSGFTGATSVSFGGNTVFPGVLSDNALSVYAVPAHAAGIVDVTVTTPGGTSATTPADRFTYTTPPPPTVRGTAPAQGLIQGGSSVTIVGDDFRGATAVSFGSTPAPNFYVTSTNQISVQVPPHVAGVVDVTVTTPGGTSPASGADQFTYVTNLSTNGPGPVVTGLDVTSGITPGGLTVTIIGTSFTDATAVYFGSTRASYFYAISDNTISAAVPAHAAGVVDVTVTTPSGTSATTPVDQFTYVPPSPPVVTALSISSGSVGGGTNLYILGTGFTGATTISFGSITTYATVYSDNVLVAKVPAQAAGMVNVTVTTPAGTSATNAADQFTYMVPPAPVVTGLSATSGSAATMVTLIGNNLADATAVSFGGTSATITNTFNSSDNALEVMAPAHAAGVVDVTVTTAGGSSATSPADQFTYVNIHPVVTAISLTSGSVGGGTEVTLIGTGLTGATAVSFGATPASIVNSYGLNSDNSLTVMLPARTLDAVYPVATTTVYRNSDGTGAETTQYAYTWFPGTARMQSKTVSKPVVSAAQNGPGAADTETTVHDIYGRPIWQQDGNGFLTYTAYDQGTGAVTKKIVDVDTTRTSDFQNLPAGWVTPPGGGRHLVTTYEVDGLGRTTVETDPNGNITYTVYNDPEHEIRTYVGWQAGINLPTEPTQVQREDRGHSPSYTETLTMSAVPHVDAAGRPDGTEAITDIQSLARNFTSPGGQVIEMDQYFSLAGQAYDTVPHLGTAGVNYYATAYDYDDQGRLTGTILPTGTIQHTVYDGLGRVISTWIGTNDTPGNGEDEWTPEGNTAPANMVEVSAMVYDNGSVGDGNLTQKTDFPGGAAAPRVTQNFYDWRDRLVASKQGVQDNENDGTHRPILYMQYDNLDEVISREQYDGDGISITITNGVPDRPPANLLRALTTSAYDDQGRVYQTNSYDVDQTNGTLSVSALTTNNFFDHRGNTLEESDPDGAVTKYHYDGAGMLVATYATDGQGDTGWSDAGSVANNNILQQSETEYDADNNPILMITRQRFHDETATGSLGDPNNSPKARVSYQASYYDAANRLTDQVNLGTNGGTPYVRPDAVPTGSDTVLIKHTDYDSGGRILDVIDPRGLVTRTSYDLLGRTTQSIAAYGGDGTPTDSTNQTTAYSYDGDDHVLTETAMLPNGVTQTTQYVYGVTGLINSNDLLAAIIYPDNGLPNVETYTYDIQGEMLTKTDRNGSAHSYSYDVLGRQTADAVTALGSGVDGNIRRLETAYDTGGRPYLYTSYDAASGGNIVNQVMQIYNGLGQLSTEYQSHTGTVDPASTPKVQYAYSEMAGGVNNSRMISMTYPNGRVISCNYAPGVDDAISRLSSISDSTEILEAYSYLGLSTVVERAHPQSGVDLTYIQQSGGPTGDAGDQYTGLDRFGRVVDQLWLDTNTGTPTDDFTYGYDADGNPLYRDNQVNPAFGELYHANGSGNGYDSLNRLLAFSRGTLDGSKDSIDTLSHSQSWTLDALGNWEKVTTDGLDQNRTANAQNQITSISGMATPGYDNNGNTITDQNGNLLVYDAWNRLVRVQDGNGNPLSAYTYDALGRRITETRAATLDLYFSKNWQVVEEQAGGMMQAQYVWSQVYTDALVERDTSDGTRLYVQQDANWNVTAVADVKGAVQERYIYDPYGQASFLTPDWSSSSNSSVDWIYLHQGGRLDPVNGLYNFRNRDYSPTLGRWIQQDPLGYPDGMSSYAYENSQPTMGLDPLGMSLVSWSTTKIPKWANKTHGQEFADTEARVDGQSQCTCNEATGKFQFTHISITLVITITYQRGFPDYMPWVKAREMEHVLDLEYWANHTGKRIAIQAAVAEHDKEYKEKQVCEDTANLDVMQPVGQSLSEAVAETAKYWDDSGKHSYGDPRMIPDDPRGHAPQPRPTPVYPVHP